MVNPTYKCEHGWETDRPYCPRCVSEPLVEIDRLRAALETAERREFTPCDEIRAAQIPEYQAEITRLRAALEAGGEVAEGWESEALDLHAKLETAERERDGLALVIEAIGDLCSELGDHQRFWECSCDGPFEGLYRNKHIPVECDYCPVCGDHKEGE